ncbi:MAG: hypothetical protein NTV25_05570 [Methanothrix sp.]|nr:hypothetical protein [Methanothrix sp.]
MLCLLALGLGAGATGAQDSSLQQSMDMTGDAFDEDLQNSLFGMVTSPSAPWFGPKFANSSSAYSFFSEFYINTSVPMISGLTPVKIDITHEKPSKIYFGSGQEVAYSQYQTAVAPAGGNELWIQKGADWSQYAIVPAGAGLRLIAFAPVSGQADYYEIIQTDSLNITSNRVNFYSGYNSMNFVADKVGRHILLFVLNNQPSQAIIVDVISQAPPAQQDYGQNPYPGSFSQPSGGSVQYPTNNPTYTTTYVPQTDAAAGDTPVTIQTSMMGYDVYVDGAYVGKDGTNGDAMDGVFRFMVAGGQTHTIRVFDGMNNYEKPMYFERGVAKVINVPPATTVYASGGLY